jgi:hypothetical protein
MAGAPGQVNRPVAGGSAPPDPSVSAKTLISPRAISSSWVCAVPEISSRSCIRPAILPLASVLPPVPPMIGRPST